MDTTRRDFIKGVGGLGFLSYFGASSMGSDGNRYPRMVGEGIERIAEIGYDAHDAGLMIDGNKLHVLGGSEMFLHNVPVVSYKVLNLNDDDFSWEGRRNMLIPMSGMAVFELDGKLITVGGRMGSDGLRDRGRSVDFVFRYNPLNNRWDTAMRDFPKDVSDASVIDVDGVPMLVGGRDSEGFNDEIYRYDKVADKWDVETRVPKGVYSGKAAVSEGRVSVYGDLRDVDNERKGVVQVYDSRGGGWDEIEMPEKYEHVYPFSRDGKEMFWGAKDGWYSDMMVESAIYSREGHGWKCKDLPRIMSERADVPKMIADENYLYLVGATGVTVSHDGMVHRIKLPKV